MKKFPLAVQMFTLRDELERDYLGTFQRVVDIGYQGVELELPPPDVPIQQLKDHLARLGLKWVATHIEYDHLTSRLDYLLDAMNAAGCQNMILAYLEYHSPEEVASAVKLFNQVGAACQSRGIQFLYHNHNHEFEKINGRPVLDQLLEMTDPRLVKVELDTYWVQRAGVDPAAYLSRLAGRCPLLHVKDMEPGPEQFFAEVGEGILDFASIFRTAESAGVEWLIVEQDEWRRPPLDCVTTSYQNLKRMGM